MIDTTDERKANSMMEDEDNKEERRILPRTIA